MQIIIDIPEDVLKRTVFYREFKDLNDCITTIKALEKATPVTPTVDTPTEQGNITTERLDTPTIYAVPVKRGMWTFIRLTDKGYGDAKAELIRCKDCIHNVANRETDPMDITDYSGKDIVCDYFMTDGQEPDDYCSKARAKEIDNAEKS